MLKAVIGLVKTEKTVKVAAEIGLNIEAGRMGPEYGSDDVQHLVLFFK
jgi:hypothetical protein